MPGHRDGTRRHAGGLRLSAETSDATLPANPSPLAEMSRLARVPRIAR